MRNYIYLEDQYLQFLNILYIFLYNVPLVPSVLLLRSYDRMLMQEIKFNRQNLLERDDYRCQYCGRNLPSKDLNMDHVIPRDRGGATSWENVVISCIRCNSRKSNRLPREAGMRLLKEPKSISSSIQSILEHMIFISLRNYFVFISQTPFQSLGGGFFKNSSHRSIYIFEGVVGR